MVMAIAGNAGEVSDEFSGWSCDPYDPDRIRSIPIVRRARVRRAVPRTPPLSLCRETAAYILEATGIGMPGADNEVPVDKSTLLSKAAESASGVKDAISEKLDGRNEPDEYERAIIDYNDAYTLLSDAGMSLHTERSRSIDLLGLVEALANSIANKPKSFDTDIEQVSCNKREFTEAEEFAKRELDAARKSAMGAGAGFAAGAAVASMAPTAAMWVVTTFGTASTGAVISALSGAAATNAAVVWLGGGAIAAGGGGVFAGEALLVLARPVGWSIAGATLLTSIALFARGKFKAKAEKQEELASMMQNTRTLFGISCRI